jgi:hypothetical protein
MTEGEVWVVVPWSSRLRLCFTGRPDPASATGARYRSGMSCGLVAVDTSVHETNAGRLDAAVLSAQVVVPMVLGPGVRSGV